MANLFIAAFGLPAGSELWIIGGVVLLLFGGAKIPQLMRGLGRGVGELKVGLEEGKKAFTDASSEDKKDDEKKGE
ncbi:MAG: twin-arginine translocase TatA/TatE family subunit [Armatimonadetes bacterium Cent15-Ar3]|jgi:sec-independent protein translocase protein TatA|nr:MAG: twin-arginine translocase TatA/TatE family subunit [Armatimonadetes bacterium Cent15-Ar3]